MRRGLANVVEVKNARDIGFSCCRAGHPIGKHSGVVSAKEANSLEACTKEGATGLGVH